MDTGIASRGGLFTLFNSLHYTDEEAPSGLPRVKHGSSQHTHAGPDTKTLAAESGVPPSWSAVDRRSGCQQQLGALHLAFGARFVQRSAAVGVELVDAGGRGQQEPHACNAVERTRVVQACASGHSSTF